MDISSLGIAGVAVITVICYLIGQAVKAPLLKTNGSPSSWGLPAACWAL